jgi:hypothetical protein
VRTRCLVKLAALEIQVAQFLAKADRAKQAEH